MVQRQLHRVGSDGQDDINRHGQEHDDTDRYGNKSGAIKNRRQMSNLKSDCQIESNRYIRTVHVGSRQQLCQLRGRHQRERLTTAFSTTAAERRKDGKHH